MEATTTLPRFCMIQSNYNNEYLQLLHTTSDVLQFGGTNNILHTRFEMVPATTGGGLYHIRSMLNNNFLAHLGDGRSMLITAVDSEPEEDQSSMTCTLFKPVWVNNPGAGHDNNKNILRLLHVKTGNYACLLKVGSPFTYDFLCTAFPTADISGCDVYNIINWEEKLTALVAEIGEIKESLASERAERKALAERLAVSEITEIILNLKKTNLSEGGSSTNKYPWMNDSPVSYCNAVTFKDLEVYEKFQSESTRITISDVRKSREDDTTNIRANHFRGGMLDGLECWVVDVAALPNNEMTRFDPGI